MYQEPYSNHNRRTADITWRSFASGARASKQLQSALDQVLPEFFGYYAASIGPLSETLHFNQSPVKHWFKVSCRHHKWVDGVSKYDALPFASDSLDIVLLPHILDFIQQPHDLLREVERVIIPEGKVIISGLNPYSWYGVRHLGGRFARQKSPVKRLIGLSRLKDWIKLIGFEVEDYIGLEFAGQQSPQLWHPLASHFSSHYLLVAKKKVSTPTPIRPSWRNNKKLVPARFAEPSVRNLVERELKKVQDY
ncbi:MAG: methyltransferase domain-containing protein [Gammaproteobacteria bacterium]|nr:methyltransferase domain-containing protein [Gammaproteobacteria bacterium]